MEECVCEGATRSRLPKSADARCAHLWAPCGKKSDSKDTMHCCDGMKYGWCQEDGSKRRSAYQPSPPPRPSPPPAPRLRPSPPLAPIKYGARAECQCEETGGCRTRRTPINTSALLITRYNYKVKDALNEPPQEARCSVSVTFHYRV